MEYKKIIIGAGLYGLYSALFCAKRGEKVLVLECDDAPFKRATYINQARVHMGYHYPRSISTAVKSRGYFERFNKDYGFCVHSDFAQVYATSKAFSWTDAKHFKKFCDAADIPCEPLFPEKYFKPELCDGAFLTREYTYDAQILKEQLLKELADYPSGQVRYSARISHIEQNGGSYKITLEGGDVLSTPFVLNASYASINQIHNMLGFEPFNIKYELCEIILCKVSEKLRDTGITVMDGPFFSIMPFGKTGLHSLTSVTFTPHVTSYSALPEFECMGKTGGECSPERLCNCNACPHRPPSAWPYMSNLARKYLRDDYGFEYVSSLFSVKPILKASEIDDSRPTVIRVFSTEPAFVSVLSGKINTVYDLDEVLTNA
ncbi:MAG: FAD-binding oxidoreductase [Oscillospiraceae bacterium]|jgi:hypothetical protein|nr:FAD-binding oxidoreductase [Oscillospiraceae bacterium]